MTKKKPTRYNNPDDPQDQCYYCGDPMGADSVEAHESSCVKNPNVHPQDDED
jgi:hypothetical protein